MDLLFSDFLGKPAWISVPAGVAEMSLTKLLIYSTAGTALWTALLALAGGLLGNVVVAGLVAWYLYRVVTFTPKTS